MFVLSNNCNDLFQEQNFLTFTFARLESNMGRIFFKISCQGLDNVGIDLPLRRGWIIWGWLGCFMVAGRYDGRSNCEYNWK